ncbi:hypothetical protein CDAR_177971 [Caerostris darwini]|uniref:Uncharacterized protein n=1 Tax=Caerostris darwini TaxID=1538125 RepID=A0AAV4WG49_9ARAC|nr:hypothetical protein CDAR_177971 [Caerostris darwini]
MGRKTPHPPYLTTPHRFWRKDGKKPNSLNAKVVIRLRNRGLLDNAQPVRTTWTINGDGGKEEPSSTLPHCALTISGGRIARNLIPLMRRW